MKKQLFAVLYTEVVLISEVCRGVVPAGNVLSLGIDCACSVSSSRDVNVVLIHSKLTLAQWTNKNQSGSSLFFLFN